MKPPCNRYFILAAAAFWAAGSLVSCERSEREEGVSAGRTIVAYLATDNDLYAEYADKIAALCRGRAAARTGELLIYADTPQGSRLLRVQPDGGVQILAEYGRENSASASVLNRVLCDVQTVCPANGYGLVFFSHASGWLPQGALQRPKRSTALTGGSSTVLTGVGSTALTEVGSTVLTGVGSTALTEVSSTVLTGVGATALTEVGSTALTEVGGFSGSPAVRSIGRDVNDAEIPSAEMELDAFVEAIPGGMLDFVVFEACLMAGVEVAYALREKADYMLASSAEILSPGFTPVYGSSLKYLLDASMPVSESLAAFGRAYMTHISTLDGVFRSATLSVVDLRQTELLAARMAELPPLADCGADTETLLQRFDRPGRYGDSPALARYFDLGECAAWQVSVEQAAAMQEQLSRTVVWQDHTERFMVWNGDDYGRYNGFDIVSHSGLTVYLPRAELDYLNEVYRSTAWCEAVAGLRGVEHRADGNDITKLYTITDINRSFSSSRL